MTLYADKNTKSIEKAIPGILTWTEDSRPESLTLGVRFYEESECEVENTHILHQESEICGGKQTY